MAKSMVSAMLGKAIQEGHIKGLDTKVGDYIKTFRSGNAENLTVGDLASMASGSNWDESYKSPFSVTTKAYFYDDLASVVENIKIKIYSWEKKYKYGGRYSNFSNGITKSHWSKLVRLFK